MIVKLKCVDSDNEDWLTSGKEYAVIDIISLTIFAIIDDHGELCVIDISNGKWEVVN